MVWILKIINTLTLAAIIFITIDVAESMPPAADFKRFKCNYDCLTDFDMCVSLVTDMGQYMICYHAQSICHRACRVKFGFTRKPRNSNIESLFALSLGKKSASHLPTKQSLIPSMKHKK